MTKRNKMRLSKEWCYRRRRRIRRLETELDCTRELIEQKTIYLDETQVSKFLDELTERIEWSTNRIVDEVAPTHVAIKTHYADRGGFPWLLKCTIGIPIMLFGVAMLIVLYQSAGLYWDQGLGMRLAAMFLGITAFDCLCLGVEIFREKDRNYIVALFSALVSLVALIIALVK